MLLTRKLGAPRHCPRGQTDVMGQHAIIHFKHCNSLHGEDAIALWDGMKVLDPATDHFGPGTDVFYWPIK